MTSEFRERWPLAEGGLASSLASYAWEPNTLSRWEAGRNTQTEAMEALLRLIRDLPGSVDYLRNHAA